MPLCPNVCANIAIILFRTLERLGTENKLLNPLLTTRGFELDKIDFVAYILDEIFKIKQKTYASSIEFESEI